MAEQTLTLKYYVLINDKNKTQIAVCYNGINPLTANPDYKIVREFNLQYDAHEYCKEIECRLAGNVDNYNNVILKNLWVDSRSGFEFVKATTTGYYINQFDSNGRQIIAKFESRVYADLFWDSLVQHIQVKF